MTTTTRTTDSEMNGSSASATARDVAAGVGATAKDVAARLPDAANATGVQLTKANERIQQESDEVLTVGTTLSLGLALGLLLGGARRVLVLLALMPAAAMGYTLFDRHSGSRRTRSS
jgi:hypothetical protein